MKKSIAAILAGALCLSALTACGGSTSSSDSSAAANTGDSDKVITVGATPTPHAEILNAAKDALEAEGYTLKVVEFTDYVQPNTALVDGDLDANYFQHTPYLNNFNKENGTDLAAAFDMHYEPFGIYAGKTASIEELADGASVAIPNDGSNETRALLLLQDAGLIKLKDGIDPTSDATKLDITENPKNLDIQEIAAEQLPDRSYHAITPTAVFKISQRCFFPKLRFQQFIPCLRSIKPQLAQSVTISQKSYIIDIKTCPAPLILTHFSRYFIGLPRPVAAQHFLLSCQIIFFRRTAKPDIEFSLSQKIKPFIQIPCRQMSDFNFHILLFGKIFR